MCCSLGDVGFICTESQCLDHTMLAQIFSQGRVGYIFVSTVFCQELAVGGRSEVLTPSLS